MNYSPILHCLSTLISPIAILILLSPVAIAQNRITPDDTLAAERSTTTPETIRGIESDRIAGGARRGANLFHSFSEFSIGENRGAYFDTPMGVENILTRVTGNVRSDILGTLGVLGDANLFLMNPNGILFGSGGRLDLRGSFVGTTASAIGFGVQGEFNAITPATPTLLTVNPSALFFNQLNGKIVSNSIAPVENSPIGRALFGLRVPDGQSLLLVGGDVAIDGGGTSGGLTAQGGRIELGGLADVGAIALDTTDSAMRLTYPEGVARSNVALVNDARVSARGNGGGDIAVNANEFTAIEGSVVVVGADGAGDAGDLTVNANHVSFVGRNARNVGAGLANQVAPNATGSSGNIIINTNSLNASDGGGVDTSTFGRGNAGDIVINASDTITLANGSALSSSVLEGAIGQGGDIVINTGTLSLTNGAQLSLGTYGRGNSGDVSINARAINFQGRSIDSENNQFPSGILARVEATGEGNAGDIQIRTGTLIIRDGAAIGSGVRGRGNGGNISIEASDRIVLDRAFTGLGSTVEPSGIGQGGNLQIRTEMLSVLNSSSIYNSTTGQGDAGAILIDTGSLHMGGSDDVVSAGGISTIVPASDISTTTGATGNAGSIQIAARDVIELDNSGISSSVIGGIFAGEGRGGDIQISTGSLRLINDSELSAFTSGKGDAGSIVLQAQGSVSLDNSAINTFVGTGGSGQGGNIQIQARSLLLTNQSSFLAGSLGQGNSGQVVIEAADRVVLDVGDITTAVLPGGVGQGGDITIKTAALSLSEDASLFTATGGQGNAGNISVQAHNRVSLQSGARLSTSTLGQGNAGNIMIQTSNLIVNHTDSSQGRRSGIFSTVDPEGIGQAGDITIRTNALTITGGGAISSATLGKGNAGTITIDARDRITLVGRNSENQFNGGIFSTVEQTGEGRGGTIRLTTDFLTIRDRAAINASTFGQGNAGSLWIDANTVRLQQGYIASAVGPGGRGNAGDVQLQTGMLTLTGGGQIVAAVFRPRGDQPAGRGNGGNITIRAVDRIRITDYDRNGFSSGIFTLAERATTGRAGNISVATQNFQVAEGGIVIASTASDRRAGNITINANTFSAIEGGQVVTNTRNAGQAGTIRLNVQDQVLLSGFDRDFSDRRSRAQRFIAQPNESDRLSDILLNQGSASGLYANTAPSSTGNGGNIFVNTGRLTIQEGAQVAVNSQGSGAGGSILLQANQLTLLDRAQISAETISTNGGNVNLTIANNLLLGDRSQITTNAGTQNNPTSDRSRVTNTISGGNLVLAAGNALVLSDRSTISTNSNGNGGNIEIAAPAVIAAPAEDSNITANAVVGSGGNVELNATLYGINVTSQETATSNITATSDRGVQGEINVTPPNVDPVQGLVELPEGILDAANQMATACPQGRNAAEELDRFVVTGRGGLPENPIENLDTDTVLTQWVTVEQGEHLVDRRTATPLPPIPVIAEAQGWVREVNGQIKLVAELSSHGDRSRLGAIECQALAERE